MQSSLIRQAAILAALAIVPAFGQAIYFRKNISWRSPTPRSEMVTVDLARAWGKSAIWVDARPDEEFERDHVPGAISLNEDRWNTLLPKFLAAWSPDKKHLVINVATKVRVRSYLYDVDTGRSRIITRALRK